MNFGYIREKGIRSITMHCAPAGRKLELIRKNPHCSFEMDTGHLLISQSQAGEPFKSGCEWGMKFQSVMGTGLISIAEDVMERKNAIDHMMRHYGAMGPASFEYSEAVLKQTLVLILKIETISCKIKQ